MKDGIISSYGDILRNNAVYSGNPVRSPLDNISISLGFFYRLGDKPHTPAPPPWYARIIAKRQAKEAMEEQEGGDTAVETENVKEKAVSEMAEETVETATAVVNEVSGDDTVVD